MSLKKIGKFVNDLAACQFLETIFSIKDLILLWSWEKMEKGALKSG